jgi:tRNA threonylcarbamoyladenosine biosynthesis protein TsaE
MAEYAGRLPLFHLDLYRLDGSADAIAGGMLDEREDEGVTLIEWADRLDAALDEDHLSVTIAPDDDDDARIIVLEAPGAGGRYAAYLEAAATWMRDVGDDDGA